MILQLIPPFILLISWTLILIGSKRARVKSDLVEFNRGLAKTVIAVSILIIVYTLTH